MPRSSSVGADNAPSFHWSHSIRYQTEEARALSALLGLSETATPPLILPMLWLGKSALPQTMRDLAGETYFVVQEAQDLVYARPFQSDEPITINIRLQQEKTDTLYRLLISADLTARDGSEIVTLKSTIRLIEKPSGPQAASLPAPKPRASSAIDHALPIIDQDIINRYAVLSGDNNPVHLDRAFAHTIGLQDTVAHGMILLGMAQRGFSLLNAEEQAMGQIFPLHLSCRFLLPLHAGQTSGLSIKQHLQDNRLSERVTLSSEAGPHVLAQIQYPVQPPKA